MVPEPRGAGMNIGRPRVKSRARHPTRRSADEDQGCCRLRAGPAHPGRGARPGRAAGWRGADPLYPRGLCHSDLAIAHGDMEARCRWCWPRGRGDCRGGRAGRDPCGPGDHVVCSFIPNCGSCRYCATGRQSICDWGDDPEGCLPGGRFPFTGPGGRMAACPCSVRSASMAGLPEPAVRSTTPPRTRRCWSAAACPRDGVPRVCREVAPGDTVAVRHRRHRSTRQGAHYAGGT